MGIRYVNELFTGIMGCLLHGYCLFPKHSAYCAYNSVHGYELEYASFFSATP